MTFDEYIEHTKKTAGCGEQPTTLALGLCGETGEVADLIKKKEGAQQRYIPLSEIREELGDVLWYWVGLCLYYGIEPVKAMEANVAKLQRRYPDGFVPGGGVR